MSIFSKVKISTALDKSRLHSFKSKHQTSADFWQLQPIYHREMVPGSKFKVKSTAFARLLDMPVPTYGDASIKLRAFFVPMRTIYRGWDDFITDALHVNSGSQYASHDEFVPYITNLQFVKFLIKSDVSTAHDSSNSLDFYINTSNGATVTSTGMHFTPFGRQCWKILRSLGYRINLTRNTSDNNDAINTERYSALPLLSFLRLYLDWYYPSQYYGDTVSALLMSLCLRDSSQDPSFNEDRLLEIFKVVCYVAYGDDYFTAAFDSPNGPTDYGNVGASIVNIDDINVQSLSESVAKVGTAGTSVGTYFGNTPFVRANESDAVVPDSPIASFSQYVLDSLKSLTDFMKRHQLVGARAFERFAARFGYDLPASKINRTVYLGSYECPMMVQDVMSLAGTDSERLGAYAGKGICASESHTFEFSTDEYGYFIICASIVPRIGYYQGLERKVKHLSKLDFFSPEFDCLGTQAIATSELGRPTTAELTSYSERVFGFTPKYAEYKIPYDHLTGDFDLVSASASAGDFSDSWHLFRRVLVDADSQYGHPVHSKAFCLPYSILPTGSYNESVLDGGQFDRIFYDESFDTDHFVCLYLFDEELYLPMKPLWDTYEFKDEDEHGTKVVDVNGIKMN